MKAALALLAVLAIAGCSRDEPSAPPQPGAPVASNAPQHVPADLSVDRSLGTGADANPFDARVAPPHRRAAAQPVPPPPEAMPQRPPFVYVGKVLRDRVLQAVLAREDRTFLVRPNDTLDGYRIQSVGENEVVLVSAEGATFSIPFSPTSGASAAPPLSAMPGADDASLRLSAPSRVSVGEQFTLTVSLDGGPNVVVETGSVEVRYDPKVLQVAGQSASSGAARLDITAAATLQFRVVATAPTATEIRVVPTSITDTEGRDVGVNAPPPHKLTIVRSAASGG